VSYEMPVDFTRHVGHEVTLGDMYRVAWRQFGRHKWPALGFGLLGWLVAAAALGTASCVAGIVGFPMGFAGAAGGPTGMMAGQLASRAFGAVVGALATGFAIFPLWSGYRWSVVRTYDGHPMSGEGLFSGFRPERYRKLLILGLLNGGLTAGIQVGMQVLLLFAVVLPAARGATPALSIPTVMSVASITVVGTAASWLSELLFLLASNFAFAEDRASWQTCLNYNWRILTSRPGQFLAVFLTHPGAMLAIMLVAAFPIGGGIALCFTGNIAAIIIGVLLVVAGGLATLVATVAAALYSAFLVAAFFRAGYGYSVQGPESVPAVPLAPWSGGETNAATGWPPAGGATADPRAPLPPIPLPGEPPTGQGTFDPGAYLAPQDPQAKLDALDGLERRDPFADPPPNQKASPP